MSESNPKYIINTFPTYNAHVDEAMQYLDGDEYKILNFAVRHILGWKDQDLTHGKPISLSMFEHGFTTKDGKQYGGTGLRRAAIMNKLERLVKYGLLIEVGKPTARGQAYNIGQNPDIQGLANDEQSLERQAANKTRGAKMTAARLAKLEGGTSHVTGTSDDTSTSHVPPGGTSHVTGGGTSHDTQLNTHKPTETHNSAALLSANGKPPKGWTPEQYQLASEFNRLVNSIVPIANETKSRQEETRRACDMLLMADVTVEQLGRFYRDEYKDSYTPSTLMEIARRIGKWLAKQPATPAASSNGSKPNDEMRALTEQRYKEKGLLP